MHKDKAGKKEIVESFKTRSTDEQTKYEHIKINT